MRKIVVLSGATLVLILALAGSSGLRQATAGPNDMAITMTGVAARANITYTITIANKGAGAVSDLYVAGLIPDGAKFGSVGTVPAGAVSNGVQGNVVAWVVSSIPGNGSVSLTYTLNAPDGTAPANAFVSWKAPTAGGLSSAFVSRPEAVDAGSAKRGCLACHYSVTLARESERGGPNHPKIQNEATVDVCLACHGAAADRTGKAPLMLRTIVHSAHLNSDSFIGRYKGNCFTCHDISETGAWTLLYDKVHLNQYNVPEKSDVNSKGYAAAGRPIVSVGTGAQPAGASVARGAQLYDKWWAVVGAAAPKDNQPLWATQTTNTRTGGDTWRCKECHGWDYKGKDGAYGSGSHKTGFAGVFGAGSTKTKDQLVAALKGSTNASHNFTSQLGEDGIANLADFLKEGLIDAAKYIDYSTKKPLIADANHGRELFGRICAGCHGTDGAAINFGSAASPEYVGTIAKDNPWEFTHKVRLGQPGSAMPAGVQLGWSVQDVMDVLAHSQTLKSN